MEYPAILNKGQISDLFFNYDHPRHEEIVQQAVDSGLELAEVIENDALLEDAKEFLSLLSVEMTPGDLVADYLKRR